MGVIRLEGHLRCATAEEARRVARHLPDHHAATRAEPGCLAFEVELTGDPLVWRVSERFRSREDFEAHQRRSAETAWSEATRGITRDYHVTEEPG